MTPKFGFALIILVSVLNIFKIIYLASGRPAEAEYLPVSQPMAAVGIILFSSALIFGVYGLWQYHKLEKEAKGGGR